MDPGAEDMPVLEGESFGMPSTVIESRAAPRWGEPTPLPQGHVTYPRLERVITCLRSAPGGR
jgi:hypothetical protein